MSSISGRFIVSQKFFNIVLFMGKIGIQFAVLLLFVALIALVGLVWRVHQSPLDISFANDYIESAMYDHETGNHARMDKAVLYWPDLKGALYLRLQGGQLLNKNDAVILSVDEVDISFSRYGLLIGRIMPKVIIVRKPTLQLTRTVSGISLDLGERPYGPVNENEKIEFTTRVFGYLARPGYESANQSLISRLRAFQIEDAQFRIDDHVIRQSWSLPQFNIGFYSTSEGMKGEVYAHLPDVDLENSSLRAEMDYVWDEKTVSLEADLNNIHANYFIEKIPALSEFSGNNIVFDAHVETLLDEDFTPSDIRFSFSSQEGVLVFDDLWRAPVPYKDVSVNASYSLSAKTLRLHDTAVTLGGVTLNAMADLSHDNLLFHGKDVQIDGPVSLRIGETRQSLINSLWPEALRGDNSEEWIVEKMSNGVFHDISVDLDTKAFVPVEGDISFDVQNLMARFSAKDMDIDYRAPLDPAVGVSGNGVFDLNKDELSIDISKGRIGVMPVSGARLVFDKVVAVGEGGADLNIDLTGDIADIFRFISKDPINLGERIDMELDQVKGSADLGIWLNFPTQNDVKIEDFKIGVEGTLKGAIFPDVVRHLDLSGDDLSFSIKDGTVLMKGDARLHDRPMAFEWHAFLDSEDKDFKEKIKAKIDVDRALRDELEIDLSDFLQDTIGADIVYTSYRGGRADAFVKADLKPALLFIEPFRYVKNKGEGGKAQFTASFKDGDIQQITNLTALANGFELSEADIRFQKKNDEISLLSGWTNQFVIGDTRSSLAFEFDVTDKVTLNLEADVLDAQPFMKNDDSKDAYDAPAMVIHVNALNMLTSSKEVVHGARLYFDIDELGRFDAMEVDGRVGNGSFKARFKHDAGQNSRFEFKSDDAGATLKAFQIYNNIRGGIIDIVGRSDDSEEARNISGTAKVKNFKVVKAPFLTKILSILSLSGIGEALSGDGLEFEKLEADFLWVYRPQGSLLKIKEGRTSGNALGVLFEGEFDNARRFIDVSGTIVPMSLVNEIIGSIPLVGDILTGGSGGVFAATYKIKGLSDDPKISVNPLSVLTPGIVRRVLFE